VSDVSSMRVPSGRMVSLGNLPENGRELNDASQIIAVMFVIVFIGVMIDTLIFAPLERRVRSHWGLTR